MALEISQARNSATLEHPNFASHTMDSSARDEKDLGHNVATKFDLESDAEIDKAGSRWSKRQIIATVSLSILWVGESIPSYLLQVSTHSPSRITSSFVLHWRHTFLLSIRPRWRRVDFFDLDPSLQYVGYSFSCAILRTLDGYIRSSRHYPHWITFDHGWSCFMCHYAFFYTIYCWHVARWCWSWDWGVDGPWRVGPNTYLHAINADNGC